MSRFMAFAGVTAVVAVVAGAYAISALPGTGTIAGLATATPPVPRSATPSVPVSAAPSAVTPAPSLMTTFGWQPFASTRYGYSADFPGGWSPTPASRTWSLDVDGRDWSGPAADQFLGESGGENVLLTAFSVGVPHAMSLSDWVAAYLEPPGTLGPCRPSTPAPISIDRHAGLTADTTCGDSEAFVRVNDRVYAFGAWRSHQRALLETFVSTVRITAPDTSTWTPYTSARYGFTIAHPADWTVTPATRSWSFATDPGPTLVDSPGEDHFTAPDASVRVSAWTIPLDHATASRINTWSDLDAWLVRYCQQIGGSDCGTFPQHAIPLCLEHRDCHPAVLVPEPDEIDSFFIGGGHPMTVVALWRGDADSTVTQYGGGTSLLEAFLSTAGVFVPNGPDNHP